MAAKVTLEDISADDGSSGDDGSWLTLSDISGGDSSGDDSSGEARYLVWYRHSGEDHIYEIPDDAYDLMTYKSVSEMVEHVSPHSITHMCIWGNMEELSVIAPHLTALQLNLVPNITQQINRLKSLTDLQDLNISYNKFTDSGLPDGLYDLAALVKLSIRECGLSSLDTRLRSLTNLQDLNISMNKFTDSVLPEVVYDLTALVKLDISLCRLSSLDDRLRSLTNLQDLIISENEFTDSVLPEVVYDLTSLVKLNIMHCGLSSLDTRLRTLTSLKDLNISGNQFTDSVLPEVVYDLTSLVKLHIAWCGLSSLDTRLRSLTNLQDLDIRGNQFTDRVLPEVVYDLTALVKLNISNCSLSSLDTRLDQLQQLEELLLGSYLISESPNKFIKLPPVITRLKNLRTLYLAELTSLRELHPDLVKLSNLEKVQCSKCESLQSPPYSVCRQGLSAIRKYYRDLAEREGVEVPIISVAVIGDRMAGKTSLVRSLREGRRVMTSRDESADEDDTTKVFEVTEIFVEGIKLRTHDFGGDQIYHISYQLAIKSNYIAIMVVNIMLYDALSRRTNSKEAARQVCIDYLSHLYLSCPRLGAPILVLTHKDKLSDEMFVVRRGEFLQAVEDLRTTMLNEEKKFPRKSNRFSEIAHFRADHLFHPDDIFHFSDDLNDRSGILKLLKCLAIRCQPHIITIPFLWERMGIYIDQRIDVPFINLKEILEKFPEDGDLVILRTKHNEGQVLWFEREPSLRQYVFHRIPEITRVIALLFHHRTESLWEQRIEQFESFSHNSKRITQDKYSAMVRSFLDSGVIDEAVLHDLYDSQEFPREVAISLLKTFYLLCGPVQVKPRSTYIIPYLSPEVIEVTPPAKGRVRLSPRVHFVELSPASFVYHLLVVAFLNLFAGPGCRIRAARNGAVVYHGEIVSWLIHDYTSRRVSVLVDTPVSHLDSSWSTVFTILETILRRLKTLWVGAHAVCKFDCAHCIYRGETEVDCDVDPDWYTPPEDPETDPPLSERLTQFRGVEPVACCNDGSNGGPLTVPTPLRFPCMILTDDEKRRVEKYLRDLPQSSPNTQSASQEVRGAEGIPNRPSLIDDNCIEEIVTLMYNQPAEINIPLTPASPNSNTATSEYELTATRGRALLLSNKAEIRDVHGTVTDWRKGSEHDHKNMKCMLEKFGFVTAGEHKNYTSKEIVEAIHRETQLVDGQTGESIHKHLSMFVLLITSHGSQGTVAGCDHKLIELTDIYKLLSAANFPAMKGKAKIVIIQACAGSERDMMLDQIPETSYPQSQPDAVTSTRPRQQTAIPDYMDIDNGDNEVLTPANLFIMQSSFDSFVSPRSSLLGSPFIRSLVITFYKHAHHCNIDQLGKVIQETVSRASVERTEQLRLQMLGDQAYVGQMPKILSTLTGLQELKLQPCVNMRTIREHPDQFVRPRYPNPTQTRIEWLPDTVHKWRGQGQRARAVHIKWRIEKRRQQRRPVPTPRRRAL